MKSFIIAKKEIMDLTRDRRTMIMMFVVPFVAMPLIFSLMFNLQKNMQQKAEQKNLKVAIFGSEYAPDLNKAFTNSEDITVFNDMSIDSIENYIKDEILDAVITIDKNYKSMILNNGQAIITVQFKGTETTGVTKERVRSVIGSIEQKIINNRMMELKIKPQILQAYNLKILDILEKKPVDQRFYFPIQFLNGFNIVKFQNTEKKGIIKIYDI
ncbi:MAG: hypothetical protein CMG08_02745, partial [Candidatus Marinimicrobia bacterium]|nr:hypothetical protein [Candidatus Neomarinimicrobiota bacterium]